MASIFERRISKVADKLEHLKEDFVGLQDIVIDPFQVNLIAEAIGMVEQLQETVEELAS